MNMRLGLGLGLPYSGRPGGALASFASAYGVTFGAGADVGVQSSATGFRAWSDLGSGWYERLDFIDDGTNRPSNRGRQIIRLCCVAAAKDFTRNGANSTLNTNGAGPAATHLGRQCARSLASGTYFEADVTGAGDLFIIYMARTSSGHVRVDIDGDQALVNELSDLGNGYKAFDSYSATDLLRKQVVKVASGLPQGTYTVRTTMVDAKHAGSTDDDIYIEAFAITTDLSGSNLEPPVWQTGVDVTIGEEVQYAGGYYSATGNGTTGATPPTHTSGTASDGGVTWRYFDRTTWYVQEADTTYASEREYALEATITATEAIGGSTHGNEASSNLAITVDDVTWDYATEDAEDITAGATVRITEDVVWSHSDDATLASGTVTRTLTPGRYHVKFEGTIDTDSVDFGWWYPAMIPVVRWDGFYQQQIYDECRVGSGDVYPLDDAAGSSPEVLNGTESAAALKGDVFGATLVTATIMPEAMGFFLHANVNSVAGASGATDWQVKAYFRRATTGSPETLTADQTFSMEANHYTAVA